jgi:transmembrane sensor
VIDMTKIAQFPNPRQIETEACAWIAQLDGGEPTPEDLAAFREWIDRSERHREEVKRLSALWSDLNILTQLAVPLKKPRRTSGSGLQLRSAAIAAVVIVSIAVGFFFLRSPSTSNDISPQLVYSTKVGEQKSIALADGSTVLMNTDSRIRVEYGTALREVHLLQGEAYFEVAHNRDRPFLVHAGTKIVRAVGTAFSVHVRERVVDVVVTEGAVELSSVTNMNGRSSARTLNAPQVTKLAALTAGQSATFSQGVDSIQTIQAPEVARSLSWREGVLSFSGEPLEQVVDEVSRYTPIKIVISDPAIRNISIGGYFKAGETDAMFEALETSFGVRVNHVNDRLVYLAAK